MYRFFYVHQCAPLNPLVSLRTQHREVRVEWCIEFSVINGLLQCMNYCMTWGWRQNLTDSPKTWLFKVSLPVRNPAPDVLFWSRTPRFREFLFLQARDYSGQQREARNLLSIWCCWRSPDRTLRQMANCGRRCWLDGAKRTPGLPKRASRAGTQSMYRIEQKNKSKSQDPYELPKQILMKTMFQKSISFETVIPLQ